MNRSGAWRVRRLRTRMAALLRSRRLPIVLTGLLGVFASAAILLLSMSWERRVARLDFAAEAREDVATINTDLQSAVDRLDTMRAFWESSDDYVTITEFQSFGSRLQSRTVGLRNISWAPRVTQDARAAYEHTMQQSGHTDFQITERGPQGGMVRAGSRPEYYPIAYLVSDMSQKPLTGLDTIFSRDRAIAAERALARDRTAATIPLNIVPLPQDRARVLSFTPIHLKGHRHGIDPADGLIVAVFDIGTIFEHIFGTRHHLAKIDVYIYQLASVQDDGLIYWRPSPSHPRPAPSEAALRNGPHWEGTVSLIDQTWGAIVVPTAGVEIVPWDWRVAVPFGAGLVLTGLAVAYLTASLRRTELLHDLTRTLQETTDDLHRKAAEVEHLACHDPLTGLPNRRLLFEHLVRAIRGVARDGGSCAVLQVDLDRFKPVNDRHGHQAGDVVLCEVASRLRNLLRGRDVVARLGGDEFAVILEGEDGPGAAALARRMVDAVSVPIHLADVTVSVGASIGVALCPDHGLDPADLLRAADVAMYEAKHGGRGDFRAAAPRSPAPAIS